MIFLTPHAPSYTPLNINILIIFNFKILNFVYIFIKNFLFFIFTNINILFNILFCVKRVKNKNIITQIINTCISFLCKGTG